MGGTWPSRWAGRAWPPERVTGSSCTTFSVRRRAADNLINSCIRRLGRGVSAVQVVGYTAGYPMTARRTRRSGGALYAAMLALLALPLTSTSIEGRGQTFRSSVDLIALDVQVRDKNGRPVSTLDAGSFEVTVDGKPRRVVSADFISLDESAAP